jgi:hypothetical protein
VSGPFFSRIGLAATGLLLVATLASGADEALKDTPILHATLLGRPTEKLVEPARKINDLFVFQKRLFLGHGDWTANTGPTDVIYFDLEAKKFVTEFTVDEEAIVHYRQYDDELFVPGADAKEGWELGNLYVRRTDGWTKLRSIPNGIHVLDFAKFCGRWYVATGSFFGSPKTGPSIGAVFSSGDRGKSWRYEYTTPSAPGTVYRIHALMPFQDRLFAFINLSGPVRKDAINQEYHSYLPKPAKWGEIEVYPNCRIHDPLGAAETIVFDGIRWHQVDLLPGTKVGMIIPFSYGSRLVLYVQRELFGLGIRGGEQLYVYDGQDTKRLDLACERIVDVVTKPDGLLVLFQREGHFLLAESSDLSNWVENILPPEINAPRSAEKIGNVFYLGLADGSIYAVSAPD